MTTKLQPLPTPADDDIVNALEKALERARAGEVQHFVMVTLDARWEATTVRVCRPYAAMVMLGAIELVKSKLVAHADEGTTP